MPFDQIRRPLPALLIVLGGLTVTPVGAQSFDCAHARTATEHAICTDARLGQLDSALAKSYEAVRNNLSPSLVSGFVAAQRAWTRRRDRGCSPGAVDCLRHAYSERLDLMKALLARTSDDNPVIDSVGAAALVGQWVVEAARSAGEHDNYQPTSADLPAEGARITGKIGEICIANPGEEEEDCDAFGLAPIAASNGTSRKSGASVQLLAYFDGKADFELEVRSSHELAALYKACNATATACERREQLWRAVSADARVNVYSASDDPSGRANAYPNRRPRDGSVSPRMPGIPAMKPSG